jgi:uracil-DNA glycosylase
VDTELMILLQDWAPDDRLSGPFLPERCTVGHDPSRRTNRRLHELLLRHFALELEEVYATNVFPFIKVHKIQPEDFVRAAEEFALPQIKIVEPRLAVCLGKAAFNAVSVAASRSGILSGGYDQVSVLDRQDAGVAPSASSAENSCSGRGRLGPYGVRV